MDALVQPFIDAIQARKIEGAVLAGRSTAGREYTKAVGSRTLLDGTTKPLKTNNLVFLASTTKLLTTIAALQCCEKGTLSLDKDLSKDLAEISEKGVLLRYDEANGEPVYEPLKKSINLRHLLTHSSGLSYSWIDPKLGKWCEANPPPGMPRNVLQRMAQPLAFQPGEGWMYSPGIDIAGYLVEKASGLKLDEYFTERLLEPLGIDRMDLSFFPVKEGMADRMPDVNPKDPEGEGLSTTAGKHVSEPGETECFGGQGGYATCGAYIAILYSITANDGKLLQPSSVAEMFKPQLEPGAREGFKAALQGPMGVLFSQGTTGSGRDHGLGGVYVGEDGDGGMGKGSLAWVGGLSTAWLMDPSSGVCGFVSPQLGLPADPQVAFGLKDGFRRGLKAQLQV